MTARAEVLNVRRWLATLLALRAGAWGIGAALILGGLLFVAGISGTAIVAVTGGVLVATIAAWRTHWPREDWRVALWVEEQVPGLQFRLVSVTDPACELRWPALERALPPIEWPSLKRAAAWRALRAPVAVVAALALVVVALPAARAAGIVPVVNLGARPLSAVRGLGDVRVKVTEPAYAGGASRTQTNPADVGALVGSTVEIEATAGAPVTGSLGDTTLTLVSRGGMARARFTMPDRPTVVRLSAAGASRLLTLTPRIDSVPALVIRTPSADTTLRAPVGRIALHAIGRDDIGIVLGGFEYIVSSGAGESFTFKSGMLGVARPVRAGEAEFRATLDLPVLKLAAGDVVHVRAVASDGLPPSPPDSNQRWRGTSETRVIRIARAGEYDSVAVEGAPPPDVEGALSQRMLLMLTEALEKRRPRLPIATLRDESRRIALDQTKLRKRVGTIIFQRLGGGDEGEHSHGDDSRLEGKLDPEALLAKADEATNETGNELQEAEGDDSPVVAINRPLLEAYNHMWDAQRALEVATPGSAIRPMRLALAAIQRARAAERLYLRGRPPTVVVDVGRVRLSGKDQPQSVAARLPREGAEAARRQLATRLRVAIEMLGRNPGAAVDSLLIVRVEALTVAPQVATVLGRATEALRRGSPAAADLALARRLLLGPARADALGAWSGGPW